MLRRMTIRSTGELQVVPAWLIMYAQKNSKCGTAIPNVEDGACNIVGRRFLLVWKEHWGIRRCCLTIDYKRGEC